MAPDDIDLITPFQAGDEKAFEQIYKLLYRPLNLFVLSITDDSAQAQDIVTDSFIKLWHQRVNFHSIAAIRSWLYMVTGNRSKDHLRAVHRHNRSHKEILYLSDESDAAIEREIIIAGVMAELYLQLKGLSPQRRRIFELICFEGKTTAEVAGYLNTSTKNVLNQKLKVISELRAALLKKNLLQTIIGFIC